MSDNISVLVVGTGYMGTEHSKVLLAQGIKPLVVGRSLKNCGLFEKTVGIKSIPGGINLYIDEGNEVPKTAVVAVGVTELFGTAKLLIEKGVKKILLEKPGAMNRKELESMLKLANLNECKVYLAYNRRFYTAVQEAKEMLDEDGGVSSFHFEFTEWSDSIKKLKIPDEVKNIWLLANSSHVIDLAFFLGGYPKKLESFVSGGLTWHKNGSVYVGAGISENGASFSYHADWGGPGRWGVEILTKKRRLIFRPIEKLQVQLLNSVQIEPYNLDDQIDIDYKPGLYKQMDAFLNNKTMDMLDLEEYVKRFGIYEKISGIEGNLYEKGTT